MMFASFHDTISRLVQLVIKSWEEPRGREVIHASRGMSQDMCQNLKMGFLPSRFSLMWRSAYGATPHDDAHGAFMTLPRHTSTREDEVQPVVEGALRLSVLQTGFPPPTWDLVEHEEGAYS